MFIFITMYKQLNLLSVMCSVTKALALFRVGVMAAAAVVSGPPEALIGSSGFSKAFTLNTKC